MKVLRDQGSINILLLPLILVSVLFVAAGAFAVWAYQGRQDYKNNVDQKIAAAEVVAKQQQNKADAKQYAELEKQPLRAYDGPAAYGSLVVNYPKTWSAYVDDSGKGQSVVDGYFNPSTVPSVSDQNSVFALRVQVLAQTYADVVKSFNSQLQGAASKPKIAPYNLPKVPSAVGIRADGPIAENKTGTMIILPLRDKTVEIWTTAPQFQNDLDTYILPNFSFSP